jgi:glyoxylase-like metal-dependent hydrolase (beta-lactamase superfamily II)
MTFTRRYFLRGGAQALGAASLLGAVPAGAFARDARGRIGARDITVKDVGGLALLSGAGCNVVALPGPDGALLVDGGLAVNSAVLLKAVSGATNTRRVHTLINTHWHPEQTGLNEAVGNAGGSIIAHEVTRLALTRAETSQLFAGTFGPLPQKALPTTTTYNAGTLEFGGEPVHYRYLPGAHTNGDLFVHFPRRNVIVAGGPVGSDRWPVIDHINGGFMHGFVRAYEILSEVAKPDTIIIPADGPTLTGADVMQQKDAYWALFKQFFVLFNKGAGPQEVVKYNQGIEFPTVSAIVAERPLKALTARLGDPAQFLEAAYRSLQLATLPF